MSKNRAYSTRDILNTKFKSLDFEGEWLASVGQPEPKGSWIIWGNSTNGKTRFALQLAKYLAQFGKVVYNSLEEGKSLSMQEAIKDINMLEVGAKFNLLDMEDMQDLKARLKRDRKIKFIVIDSLQYSGLTYSEYKRLRDEFGNKMFVFVSHADGKEPAGATAKSIRYDAFVKIWVEGFKAFPQSRYGGGEPYVIWEDGASKYFVE